MGGFNNSFPLTLRPMLLAGWLAGRRAGGPTIPASPPLFD
jgi:hypothetical protein